jgi:uncharacterized repeat protein (TIGR01451 family)
MPRATTAYASKYQRYRVWRGEYYRSETFTLEFDCKGAIPDGDTISGAVWQSLNTANVILGQSYFYDTRTTITCTAALEPGGPVKCTVTLSSGNTLTQLFIVLVNSAPWFCADTNPSSGPCHVTSDGASPALQVTKTADPSTFGAADEQITYTYTLYNTGNATLSNITANDDLLGPITLGATTLISGDSTTGTIIYTTDAGDVSNGEIINTVTVNATAVAGSLESTAQCTVLYDP